MPRTVADYMSGNAETVSPDDDVEDVLPVFRSGRYRRLPVVENGRLVGVVSRRDLMRLIVTLDHLEIREPLAVS